MCNLPDASHRSSRNHFSTVIALVLRFVLSSKYCRTNRNFSKKDTFGKKLINTNIIETCSLSSYLIDFIIHEFVDKFQTILVLPYLKKKEKEKKHVHPRYVKRELITRINKRRKEFAGFDDVPKLNCAKGSGKGGGSKSYFHYFHVASSISYFDKGWCAALSRVPVSFYN